jgi:methyltransferase
MVAAVVAGIAFGAGQALRLIAIRTLGERWTVKVITLPGEPAVAHGIFRYLRHPNYLGVIIEIAALPMLHGAYLTALTFSVLNLLLLRARIRAEERALSGSSTNYGERFQDRPRLLPKLSALRRRARHP